jgi:hypothetical protein
MPIWHDGATLGHAKCPAEPTDDRHATVKVRDMHVSGCKQACVAWQARRSFQATRPLQGSAPEKHHATQLRESRTKETTQHQTCDCKPWTRVTVQELATKTIDCTPAPSIPFLSRSKPSTEPFPVHLAIPESVPQPEPPTPARQIVKHPSVPIVPTDFPTCPKFSVPPRGQDRPDVETAPGRTCISPFSSGSWQATTRPWSASGEKPRICTPPRGSL